MIAHRRVAAPGGIDDRHCRLRDRSHGLARELGIVVRRAIVPEDMRLSLFKIVFWKQFKICASVSFEDENSHDDAGE